MVTRSMRCAAKAEEKAAARMNAAASDSSQAHGADETRLLLIRLDLQHQLLQVLVVMMALL